MRSFPLAVIALILCSLAPTPSWAQQVHCKPCWYSFGQVQIGNSANYSFTLTNTGSKVLRVVSESSQNSAFSFGSLQLPVKVQPGQSLQIPVIFTPTVAGETQGILTITSNDPNSPQDLKVSGNGVSTGGSQLTVSPATLNFGNVTVGSTSSLQATLTASNGTVTISSDRSNSSEFVITGLSLPIKVASGKSVQATIQFTPNASGTATAKAGFNSNAVNSPTLEQLTGTGVAQGSHDAYLTWDPGDGNAVGYNVYRGATHGGPYQQINSTLDASTNYTDYSVVGGTTYYYVATEVDNQGQESGYSKEVKAIIPNN